MEAAEGVAEESSQLKQNERFPILSPSSCVISPSYVPLQFLAHDSASPVTPAAEMMVVPVDTAAEGMNVENLRLA